MEHKVPTNARLVVCSHGYTLCYAGKPHGDYSGIVMFIRDHYHPQIIFSDDNERYMVVQISYEGESIWLVGVNASNVLRERQVLWEALDSLIRNGKPSLFMGDFHVCCDVGQSTSRHFVMDEPEAEEWAQF